MTGLLQRWVSFCHEHHRPLLIGLCVMTIVATMYNVRYGAINSDLSTLIKPSAENQWYADNERFKQDLPLLQKTAVVVLKASDYDKLSTVTTALAVALTDSGYFDAVFAPGVDPFLVQHRPYQLTAEQRSDWLQGVAINYGFNLRLADSAGLSNLVIMVADHISARHSLPMPEPMLTLLASLARGTDDIVFRGYPRLIDPDLQNHYELIMINATPSHDVSLPNQHIVRQIQSVISDSRVPEDVTVRLTGEVMLANEEISAALNGVGLAGVVSLILLAVILSWGVRSARAIAAIFALLLVGVTLTMAFATLTIGSYNTLSLIFVVMFFGLGVDFAVHYILRVQEASQAAKPFAAAIADIGPALLLCMVTSMIAFLSFVPTEYRGLAELGMISAGGMVIAFILTVTLLPAVLKGSRPADHSSLALKTMAELPPTRVVVATLMLALLAGWFAKDLTFDYSVLAMRDQSTEGMSTLLELQEASIATDYSISVMVAPENIAPLAANLTALPQVGALTSIADLVPPSDEQQATLTAMQVQASLYADIELLAEDPDPASLAMALAYLEEVAALADAEEGPLVTNLINLVARTDKAALAAINAKLEAALRAELAAVRSLLDAQPYTLEKLPQALIDRFVAPTGTWHVLVQPAAPLLDRQTTSDFILAVQSVAPNIAGRSVVEWGVGSVVVDSFVTAGSLALTLILVLLYVYFRHPFLPLLVLIPIVLSLLFTAAVCVLTGLTLNMANILVVPLIIGLGVDTGIHVVHRFTALNSVDDLYGSSTARAAVISALTTIGTFASLAFSPHKGAASVGLLLAIAISLMLCLTFLLLPALLRLTRYR